MSTLPPVNIVFNAVDRLTGPVKRMNKSLKSGIIASAANTGAAFSKAQKRTSLFSNGLNQVAGRTKALGGSLTSGVTLPVIGLGFAIGKIAGDFEASMKKLQSLTKASGKDFEALNNTAKELGNTTKFSAQDAADSMTQLAMSGMKTNEVLGATPKVLELAAASGLELAESADIVTNIMSGYGVKAKDLGPINDMLVNTFNNSTTTLSTLGESFKKVGPVAASAGIAFKDTSLAIGLLGNAGIRAEDAGTALRNTILRIGNDSKKAMKVFKDLKINRGDLMDEKGNLKSFEALFNAFRDTGVSGRQLADIFGDRTGPALMAALNQPAKAADELKGKIEDSTGAAADAAKVLNEGFNGAMASMTSSAQGLIIALGDSGILLLMEKLIKKVTGLLRWIGTLNPALLKWGTIIIGVVAAIGPLLLAIGALSASLSSMIAFWPVLVGAWTLFSASIIPAAFTAVMSLVTAAIPALISAFGALSVAIMSIPVVGWIIAAVAALIAAGVLIYKNWDAISEFFKNFFEFVIDGFTKLPGLIKNLVGGIWNSLPKPIQILLTGGLSETLFSSKESGEIDKSRSQNGKVKVDINHNNAPAGTEATGQGSGEVDLNLGAGIMG